MSTSKNNDAGTSKNTTSKRAPRYIGHALAPRVPERFICDEYLSPMMVANAALALVARYFAATTEHGSAVAKAATRDDREGHLETAKALAALAVAELARASAAPMDKGGNPGGAASYQRAGEAGSLAGWMLRAVAFQDAVNAGYAAGTASDDAIVLTACNAAGVRLRAA